MDPGSVVLALVGCLFSLIGLLIIHYAGEMEPAPVEGTLYEHASPRARERIYREFGLLLAVVGAAAAADALLLGASAAVFTLAAGAAVLLALYCIMAPRMVEEALLAEPPAPGESAGQLLIPPGKAARLASAAIALAQLPLVAKVFCSLLSSEAIVCASILFLLEAPTILLACYTTARPDAYYTPGMSIGRYKQAVLLDPPISSFTPLGVAIIASGAICPGLIVLAASVVGVLALRAPLPRKI